MTSTTTRPRVTRPGEAGSRGYPFGLTLEDLDAHGYRADELFLEGVATRYRAVPGTDLGADGRWSAEPSGTAPYRTRVLVYRPVDAGRFNGTVVLHWNNVTAGYDLFGGDTPEIFAGGYAFAGLTTQRVGIHGLPLAPQGLQAWDPERYATLSIASDDDSYDVFTQAARAVGPDRDRTTDPLGGLDVQRVIAMGSSQSAGRLGTYVNAIQPIAGVIDGFLLFIYFGSGTPLAVGDEVVNIVNPSEPFDARAALRGRNLLRDDLDVPVMVVNSELEAISCQPVRQPNTDRFRYWEAAGTCHVSQQSMDLRAPRYERDFGMPLPMPPNVNHVSMTPLYDAALHHLHRWLTTGEAPPTPPLIDFAGDPPDVVRDEHGIARGGIRLPQVEVPIAQNSAIPVADDIFSVLYGSSVPFPAAQIRAMYGDAATYLARFEVAARAAEEAGLLLPRDVPALVDEARASFPEETASLG
ncbi:MAG: alpha/beta hydrolase domain-containing protein [Ilumatobacteraceae bacterium]